MLIDSESVVLDLPPSAPLDVPLPQLETLRTSGVSSARMRTLVESRRNRSVPLKRVSMNRADVDVIHDQNWLKENVGVFELFKHKKPDTEIDFYFDEEEEGVEDEVDGFAEYVDNYDNYYSGPDDEDLEYYIFG
ncbi:hypothetical protein B0H21DRAFT_167063 [Amylocystis lapponica]|nr:hypothetical protein B0H21DRAFT_167063 [Amylocystis lapponica]